MNIDTAYFLKSCRKAKDFPNYPYPEFAFLGRSNVGKSSLLNMLLGKKGLVKTGSKPGVTRTVNFFVVNDNTSFADLPGYGYAKLPEELRKQFLPMIRSYITGRNNLKLAFLLIDIRRVPDRFEHDLIELLGKNGIPTAVTLTKCDKLSKNQRKKNVKKIISELEIEEDSVFYTSVQTGEGKRELLKLIDEYRN